MTTFPAKPSGKNSITPGDLAKIIQDWETANSQPIKPITDDVALEKLQKSGMTETDINRRLDILTLAGKRAPHRVIANYPDLHALDRLDDADQGLDLSRNVAARGARAVLQAAELAILNIQELSQRITKDVEAYIAAQDGKPIVLRENQLVFNDALSNLDLDDVSKKHIGDAMEKNQWISSFNQSLFSLSRLAARMPLGGEGTAVGIADSPHMQSYRKALDEMQGALIKAGFVSAEQIGQHKLHEASRNLTHNAFVDTMYEGLWALNMTAVNLPGVRPEADEDKAAFYKRAIGPEAVHLAVFEIDQIGENNFYRQFRAYHQMSEVLLKHANRLLVDAAKRLIDTNGPRDQNLLEAKENLRVFNAIIEVVVENVIPVNRDLSTEKFHGLRGSLGITSGSHSPNIKNGLFALYEHIMEAVKFRVMETPADQIVEEGALRNRLEQIVANPRKDFETSALYDLLSETVGVHSGIRAWRGTHMQFVRGNLGAAGKGEQPAVSISSTVHPLMAIHQFGRKEHGSNDPVVPIYEVLLGSAFNAIQNFAATFAGKNGPDGDGFTSSMLRSTAQFAREKNPDTQGRVLGGPPY